MVEIAAAAPLAPFSTTLTSHRHANIPTRNNVSLAPLDEHMGLGLGFTPLSASKSSSGSYPSRDNNKSPSSAPLSGSDVLLALQRAAAEKAKRAAIRKAKKGKRAQQGGAPAPAPAEDYSEVRPLKIRSDWGARLEELERLLQELKMVDEGRFELSLGEMPPIEQHAVGMQTFRALDMRIT